jgi:hypothetical protein
MDTRADQLGQRTVGHQRQWRGLGRSDVRRGREHGNGTGKWYGVVASVLSNSNWHLAASDIFMCRMRLGIAAALCCEPVGWALPGTSAHAPPRPFHVLGPGASLGVSRRAGEERTDRASSIEDGEMAQRRICLGRRGMARKLGFERTMRSGNGADGRRSSDET